MRAAEDQRWADDPSPSFATLAERAGVELLPTSPEHPAGDLQWQIVAFWPMPPATRR